MTREANRLAKKYELDIFSEPRGEWDEKFLPFDVAKKHRALFLTKLGETVIIGLAGREKVGESTLAETMDAIRFRLNRRVIFYIVPAGVVQLILRREEKRRQEQIDKEVEKRLLK